MPALKVVRVSKSVLWSKITVKAKRDTEAYFDSFMGERVFFLEKGDHLTLRVKGRDWERGDKLSISSLVGYALQPLNIPWNWN